MKFNRVPVYLVGRLDVGSLQDTLNGLNGGKLIACWVSDCGKVVVATREWDGTLRFSGPRCSVDVFANKTYAVGFHCELDGSVAFVANELLEALADSDYTGYDALKQFLMEDGLAMSEEGKTKITLPSFHKYKEGQ